MSTGLVLGLAGAAIGFFTGGVGFIGVGFLAGSLLGNLIDPPKVEGPRLSDLKLQVSSYGKMIPWVWGKGRLAGNVIDQTDLIEHKQQSGGKGGPEVTSYTYSATFAIALCQTPIFGRDAIVGVLRLWADGRLIWDHDSSSEDIPCTVYVGSETQEPDPTLEAIHGVDNVPAYRGIAYLVFADYSLTDFGNRIPQIEAEVYTKGGDIPQRISLFDPKPVTGASQYTPPVTYDDGTITVVEAVGTNGFTLYTSQFALDGTQIGTTVSFPVADRRIVNTVANSRSILTVDYHSGIDYYWFTADQSSVGNYNQGGLYLEGSEFAGNQSIYQNNAIYTVLNANIGGETYIAGYSAPNEIPVDAPGFASASLGAAYAHSTVALGTSNTGHIYVCVFVSGPNTTELWKFNEDDLSLVKYWSPAETAGTNLLGSELNFHVYNDLIVNEHTAGSLWYISLVKIGAGDVLEDYGVPLQHTRSCRVSLGGCLLLDVDGVFSVCPPAAPALLSEIVGDLSDNTPVPSYDVSELTDEVRWFVLASIMPVRNAIQTLRPVFFFDGREHDDIAEFKKRGGQAVAIIPDSILCARPYGEESGDPLRTIRKRETALPRTVSMSYIDVDTDYQVGVQSSPRQTTLSQQDVTMEVAVGMTAQEAAQKCWAVQSAEWIERETFEWSTTRGGKIIEIATNDRLPACVLEVCDVVIVRGREIRIVTRNETPTGVIKFTGVLSAPSIYTEQSAPGSGGGGFVPQEPPGAAVSTQLILLDIPYRTPSGNPWGFTAAMGPSRDGRWTGAALYKSLDGGVTWAVVASTETPNIIGRTEEDSGSPFISGELAPYFGGDVLDPTEIRVVLTDDDATLESVTDAALALGANLCAVSRIDGSSPPTGNWELCQFRDAVLVDTKTYVLSNWLRGRHGTDTDGHADGDTFVMLPATNVDAPQAELNVSLKYKAVTYGTALADAAEQDFTNTGLGAVWWTGTVPPYTGGPGGGVPPPTSGGSPGTCDPTYFLNECGEWAVPAGSGGSTPTGTGFRHVTAGVEDGVAVAVDLSSAHATGTLAAARFPALTGPVTTVAGALATTITNNAVTTATINAAAVTNAKLASMANNTYKGRRTAGPGDPEDVTLANLKTDLGLTGTNSGDQTITLTGDVTGTGTGSFAATIANNAVTNAKAAQMAAHTIKGNNTGSTANAIDLTLAQAAAELGSLIGLVVQSPAYAATVTVDLTGVTAAIIVVNVGTLTGNITFNITNGTDGQIIRARFKQDGTGSRLFTGGAQIRYSNDTPAPTLTTAINKIDRLGFEWHGADGKADLVAVNKGY